MKKIALPLFLILLIISCKKEIQSSATETYLSKNKTEIVADNTENTANFIFPKDLSDNAVFFVGEHHGTMANRPLDLHFLKTFEQKMGIQYLFSELGYGAVLDFPPSVFLID